MTADVLVIGNTTADYIFELAEMCAAGQKVEARAMTAYLGGQAANAAWTMIGLGLSVHFVGRFGADDNGEDSFRALATAGCILTGSCRVEQVHHPVAAVLVDDRGERSIVLYKDTRLTLPASSLRREMFDGVRAFYSDGHEVAATAAGLRLARAAGVLSVADAENTACWPAPAFRDLDELVAPLTVARELAGVALDPNAAVTTTPPGPRVVVATAGSAGCIVSGPDAPPTAVPAAPARTVDSTGAGDAFHGAYVAARLGDHSPLAAAAFASRVAACACEHPGPRLPAAALTRFAAELPARNCDGGEEA